VSPSLTIVFAGTPEFSVPTLEALARSQHRVAAVYTQPDQPAGRGQKLAASAVKQCALRLGLPIEQPRRFSEPGAVETLAGYRADVMVVVAYGLILPRTVLATPRFGCINIHASLLPRWRGAAPIQRAVLAGDTHTGVAIMQMEAGLDTGPVWRVAEVAIGAHETAGGLHDRLAVLGPEALLPVLESVAAGAGAPTPQTEVGMIYAAKIRKEEATIDWSRTAVELDRQIRAFNPWPVADTRFAGQQLRIWEAHPEALGSAPRDAEPGRVLACDASGVLVLTGAGTLRLTRVQAPGRKAMAASEFAKGHPLLGSVLGQPVTPSE
jgi:methionyl-tRNA formyltransferase